MTDGDGLTYRVLLGSGGFSDAVCAKQLCILKQREREVNKPQLTYLSGSCVSPDRWKKIAITFHVFLLYEPKLVAVSSSLGRE